MNISDHSKRLIEDNKKEKYIQYFCDDCKKGIFIDLTKKKNKPLLID